MGVSAQDLETIATPSLGQRRRALTGHVTQVLLEQQANLELAQAILLTPQKSLAARVQDQIGKQLKTLDRAKIAKKALSSRGAIVVARDMNHCIELANRYAPEHLVIASDIVDRDFPTIGPDKTLEEALTRFHTVSAERLPVVTSAGVLAGSLAKADLLLALEERLRALASER